jgi:TRAP-type transport system small permease protein
MRETTHDRPAPERPAEDGRVRLRWLHTSLDGYHRFAVVMDRVVIVVAGLFFVVGVGATFVGVLGRQFPTIFTNVTWYSEVTNLSIIAAVLLVVPRGLRDNTQMAVTFLPARLGHRGLQVLTFFTQLLVIAFFFVVVRYGVDVMNLNRAQRTPVLGLSLFWPYLLVVISGALMLLESVVRLLEAIAGRAPRPPDGETAEF